MFSELGADHLAELLSVSPSTTSRRRSGEESIGADSARHVLDLDYILSRLLRIYPAGQAIIWLHSHNAHIGSRPADALRLRGAYGVILAIEAESEGACA
jgi:hypothetical protein